MNTATAETKIKYTVNAQNFSKIPGNPIAYWASSLVVEAFSTYDLLGDLSEPRQGIIPGNIDAFVRLWFEVDCNRIGYNHEKYEDIMTFQKKWFLYNKGGGYRKWYGNIEHLINMENNGYDIRFSGLNNNYRLREPELYFKEALTWSKISSGTFSMRYMPMGCLFDIAGCCVFNLNSLNNYVLGIANSKVIGSIIQFLSPTLNYEVEHIKRLPVRIDVDKASKANVDVEHNINLSKEDWDAFETSWDFKKHPLI